MFSAHTAPTTGHPAYRFQQVSSLLAGQKQSGVGVGFFFHAPLSSFSVTPKTPKQSMAKRTAVCGTCNRDPERMNSEFAECSHLECPHRRHAWSERTWPVSKGPWPKNVDADPLPLDVVLKGRA